LGAALALATLPSGASVVHSYRRWWLRAGLAGAILSLAIELAQLFVPGRVTDVDDLILNTIGALAGSGLVALLAILLRRRI
jgi:glycopeptide antibiotics resistance protein